MQKCSKVKIELKDVEIEADEVLHVPDVAVNLLSVYQICKKDKKVIFNKDACVIRNAS